MEEARVSLYTSPGHACARANLEVRHPSVKFLNLELRIADRDACLGLELVKIGLRKSNLFVRITSAWKFFFES